MLKGFATISYFEAAFPGQPVGYYEFRIGDYQHELGPVDTRYAPPGAAGTLASTGRC